MGEKQYDLVVIGGGPGGYMAAIRAAQCGLSAALIEKRGSYGGTCLNIGCIPSKALLDSSELYFKARQEFAGHGIHVSELSLDLKTMMARKERIVEQLTGGVAMLLKKNGVDTFQAGARLAGSSRVELTAKGAEQKQLLQAGAIVLASGSVPVELPFLPVDGKGIIGSTEALSLERVPKSLIVVGAGAIGLELGSIWARLGAEVTLVELLPQILPGWDSQVARALKTSLGKQGLRIQTGTRIESCRKVKGKLMLQARDSAGKELEFTGDTVLVSVGRRPCTQGLGLEALGVSLDEGGRVKVDERFMSNVEGIYAIGDLIKGPMLAHKAGEEGLALAEILAGKPGLVNYETIPSVVYTWPEAAAVGWNEEQLQGSHTPYNKGIFSFKASGRALAMAAGDGFVKVLAGKFDDRVLGVQIVGPFASELITEAVTVMEFGGSSEDIARTVHAHPTLSEVLKEAALDVEGRAIHAPPKQKK